MSTKNDMRKQISHKGKNLSPWRAEIGHNFSFHSSEQGKIAKNQASFHCPTNWGHLTVDIGTGADSGRTPGSGRCPGIVDNHSDVFNVSYALQYQIEEIEWFNKTSYQNSETTNLRSSQQEKVAESRKNSSGAKSGRSDFRIDSLLQNEKPEILDFGAKIETKPEFGTKRKISKQYLECQQLNRGKIQEIIALKRLRQSLRCSKRMRTIFTNEQLQILEQHFLRQQYMVGQQRISLAKELGLTEAQVKVWFQNRRIKTFLKWRRIQYEEEMTLVKKAAAAALI